MNFNVMFKPNLYHEKSKKSREGRHLGLIEQYNTDVKGLTVNRLDGTQFTAKSKNMVVIGDGFSNGFYLVLNPEPDPRGKHHNHGEKLTLTELQCALLTCRRSASLLKHPMPTMANETEEEDEPEGGRIKFKGQRWKLHNEEEENFKGSQGYRQRIKLWMVGFQAITRVQGMLLVNFEHLFHEGSIVIGNVSWVLDVRRAVTIGLKCWTTVGNIQIVGQQWTEEKRQSRWEEKKMQRKRVLPVEGDQD